MAVVLASLAGVLLGFLLSRKNGRLNSILNRFHDGVVLMRDDGEIIYSNDRVGGFLGLKENDGQSVRLALARIAELSDYLGRMSRQEESGREITVRTGYPNVRYLRVRATYLAPRTILITLTDVTRIYHLERMRRQFTADLSHQLRTPVTSIRLLSETLERDPERGEDIARRIHRETQRLESLVNEILMLSRLESGDIELEWEQLTVRSIVGEAVESVDQKLRDKDLEVVTELDGEAWWGDHDRLAHAVGIYLDNAIKYSPEGGKIRVSSFTDECGHTLTVSDEGPGIPEKEQPHVFQRFFRGRRQVGKNGFGLGLAIAKHIIGTHSGEVFVDSEVGRGSTFGFTIPRCPADSRTLHE